jgi:hypothetical protein
MTFPTEEKFDVTSSCCGADLVAAREAKVEEL